MEKEKKIIKGEIKQKKDAKGLKILIVEDQEYPTIAILNAIEAHFENGQFGELCDVSQGGMVRLVDNLEELEELLVNSVFDFDIVFLDNRIFEKKIPRKPSDNKDYLNENIRDKFMVSADIDDDNDDEEEENIPEYANAYSLIGKIKERGALVIGTSSMNEDELRRITKERPDFMMSKMFGEANESLGKIKSEALDEVRKKKPRENEIR